MLILIVRILSTLAVIESFGTLQMWDDRQTSRWWGTRAFLILLVIWI